MCFWDIEITVSSESLHTPGRTIFAPTRQVDCWNKDFTVGCPSWHQVHKDDLSTRSMKEYQWNTVTSESTVCHPSELNPGSWLQLASWPHYRRVQNVGMSDQVSARKLYVHISGSYRTSEWRTKFRPVNFLKPPDHSTVRWPFTLCSRSLNNGISDSGEMPGLFQVIIHFCSFKFSDTPLQIICRIRATHTDWFA